MNRSAIPTEMEYFMDVLREGRAAGMPKFRELSTVQIEALQHHIRKLAREQIQNQGAQDTRQATH